MRKLALLLIVLAACGKKEEKPKPEAFERAQPDERKPVEPKPTPSPSEEPPAEVPVDAAEPAAATGDGGKCTVFASVGREFKQVSGGGPSAAKVYQWETPETRKEKGYKDEGFILNCNGSDINLSITSVAAIPFGMKQYKVGEETAQAEVSGTLGNTRIAKATGNLTIDKFDEKRITGRLTTYISETVPPGEMIRIVADFDFTCSGLSGCK